MFFLTCFLYNQHKLILCIAIYHPPESSSSSTRLPQGVCECSEVLWRSAAESQTHQLQLCRNGEHFLLFLNQFSVLHQSESSLDSAQCCLAVQQMSVNRKRSLSKCKKKKKNTSQLNASSTIERNSKIRNTKPSSPFTGLRCVWHTEEKEKNKTSESAAASLTVGNQTGPTKTTRTWPS